MNNILPGHARAQFIPQKKHRRSQAPTEQVEPDHGVPIPTPEAANANTPPQKPESGRFGKSVFYDNLMEETKVKL